MDQKNDQKNGQKWLKILSKKMVKNDQKNVPKMTKNGDPKLIFLGPFQDPKKVRQNRQFYVALDSE